MYIIDYIKASLLFIIVVSALCIPISFYLRYKGKHQIRVFACLLFFFAVSLIVFATILITPEFEFNTEERFLNLIPFQRFTEKNINVPWAIVAEIIPNTLLFIPLGLMIPIVFKKMRKSSRTIPCIFMVTFAIEFFQYFIGRRADIDDIITNLFGGLIGYALFQYLNTHFKNKIHWNLLLEKNTDS